MLIFFVHLDPRVAARYSPDCFIDKLIVEARQMFGGALWHFSPGTGRAPGYANHPYTLWIASSEWAWDWLVEYCRACAEVEKPLRFGATGKKPVALNRAWLWIRDHLVKPPFFRHQTVAQTPPIPLPAKALAYCHVTGRETHQERIIQMRVYHWMEKWDTRWQYLYRVREPPFYLIASEEQTEQMRKRIKFSTETA